MADGQDLRRLGKGDLMDLLLEQMKENERLDREVRILKEKLAGYEESFPRLQEKLSAKDAKLDAKDAQIERLKARLDEKDEEIGRMRAVDEDNPGTLAAAA